MSKDELSSWFKERPKWVQEAAKRLFNKGKLEDQDVKYLAEMCCGEAISPIQDSGYTFPADAFKSGSTDSIHLCCMGEVSNINQLDPKKPLCFGEGNLSIVYGQNGSGKTGYVRILKHACGVRHPGTLYPNIYSIKPLVQQCSISYKKNGVLIPCQWIADSGSIKDLLNVDIFDDSCGQAYIAEENEVTYEPQELIFFSSLIRVCDNVSDEIGAQIKNLVSKIPELPIDYTSAISGHWYAKLSKDTSPTEISIHCKWDEDDQKQLDEVKALLSEQSPAEKAKQLRIQKQHADTILENTQKLLDNLSDENCQIILTAKNEYLVKAQAANTAAERIFVDAPLEGIGSDVWKLLWEQARKYSEEQVYKDVAFPFVGENARCVLCHQYLSEEAKIRTQSFENFIKGELQKDAEDAKKAYNDALDNIQLPSVESLTTKADAAGLAQDHVIPIILDSYMALSNRKEQLLTIDSLKYAASLPQCTDWMEKVRVRSSMYEESAQRFEETAETDNRAELGTKQVELQTRKWLSEQQKSIEVEVSRLKKVDILKVAQRSADTRVLSRKTSDLADTLITEAFISRFNNELIKLRANRIKIQIIKTRADKGHVLHRLRLSGAEEHSPNDILSEGEHRIIALAAFLADVGEKQNVAPFVFDDPISSLDQYFEEAVAQRLVALSTERQVIVFTHRLSLLGLIQEYAEKADCAPKVICVRQEPWGTGEPGDIPLWAAKTKKAINILLNDRLKLATYKYEKEGRQAYDMDAQLLCSEFRMLLERIIEFDLLADVVKRFRRTVNTQGKIAKLAQITDTDCKFFDDMMTKYSRYEHSQPVESPVTLPSPDEFKQDFTALKTWHDEFTKRR